MFRDWFKNVIYAGLVNEESADVRKQILISSLFSLISFVLLIIYGIDSLVRENLELAAVVLLTAVVSGVNYLFLCRTGKYRVSSFIVVILMSLLCLYLLCTGGSDNTGPLWLFVLPGLAFYVFGLFKGTIFVAVLMILVCYILFIPGNSLLQTQYTLAFVQRFSGAMFSVCLIAYIYEYSREDGRKELLNLSRKLDQLSRRDELTGLSNRRDMFDRLRYELHRFERSGKAFSVLIADIDHFKSINDTYGHECGDEFLKEIAKVMRVNIQKRDAVARWGGEEFLIFLPETSGADAEKTAERLRRAVADLAMSYNDSTISTTTSIGLAEYTPGQSLNELINTADKFLYLAKREGRNRVKRTIS